VSTSRVLIKELDWLTSDTSLLRNIREEVSGMKENSNWVSLLHPFLSFIRTQSAIIHILSTHFFMLTFTIFVDIFPDLLYESKSPHLDNFCEIEITVLRCFHDFEY